MVISCVCLQESILDVVYMIMMFFAEKHSSEDVRIKAVVGLGMSGRNEKIQMWYVYVCVCGGGGSFLFIYSIFTIGCFFLRYPLYMVRNQTLGLYEKILGSECRRLQIQVMKNIKVWTFTEKRCS